MAEISRRAVLGAAGTGAAAVLTATGAAPPAAAVGTRDDIRQTTTRGADTSMAVTTEEKKYQAYVTNEDSEWAAHAVFDAYSDPGDMWAFVDAALLRLRGRYPSITFTGHVERFDEVITDIAHP